MLDRRLKRQVISMIKFTEIANLLYQSNASNPDDA
jgi:hypothetical protein